MILEEEFNNYNENKYIIKKILSEEDCNKIINYVNCNNKEPEFKWRLDAIYNKIGITGIVSAFKTANFLDAPHLERGIAFLIGYLLDKTSYDTKFRVFSHMRYNLGHLTSTQEFYEPTEPIHPGWQDLIRLMEPGRFALSREVVSIINNTGYFSIIKIFYPCSM